MDDQPLLYGFNKHDLQSCVSIGWVVAGAIIAVAIEAPDPGEVIERALNGVRLQLQNAGVPPYVSDTFRENLRVTIRDALRVPQDT